jgi:ADP-ribose pyrophosphatase YjhB (NUDIX family)
MSQASTIEVIARGVCVMDGHILLCHGKKSRLTYLPGGHVEFGETARQALVREMLEESGRDSEAGRFLGCCEHTFLQDGEPHAEINLVFELTVEGISPQGQVEAVEDWIGFRWHPLGNLAAAHFEPAALGTQLTRWLSHPGAHMTTFSDGNQAETISAEFT